MQTPERAQGLRGRRSPHGGAWGLLDGSPRGREAISLHWAGPRRWVSHPKLPPFVKGQCREKPPALQSFLFAFWPF